MLKAIFFRCFDVNALKYKTTQAKQKKISIYKCYTCNVNLHDRHIKSIQYLYYILFVNVYNIFHFLCPQYKFKLQITYKGTILNFYPSTTTKNKQYFSGTNFFFFFFLEELVQTIWQREKWLKQWQLEEQWYWVYPRLQLKKLAHAFAKRAISSADCNVWVEELPSDLEDVFQIEYFCLFIV